MRKTKINPKGGDDGIVRARHQEQGQLQVSNDF